MKKYGIVTRMQSPNVSEHDLRRLYFEEKLTQAEIAIQLGSSQGAIYRLMKKLGITTRNHLESKLSKHQTQRAAFNGDLCEKAYLIGFRTGDLHVWIRDKNSQTIRVMTNTTKEEQRKLFLTLFEHYGHVYISPRSKTGATSMAAYLDMSFDFLLPRHEYIPEWILEHPENFFAFFAGYCDAEAHIGVHGGYAVFKVDSYDKGILFQSYDVLLAQEIKLQTPKICRKQGHIGTNGFACRADMWRLMTNGKSTLLALFGRLRPYMKHPKRIQDMQTAIENIAERNKKKYAKRTEITDQLLRTLSHEIHDGK